MNVMNNIAGFSNNFANCYFSNSKWTSQGLIDLPDTRNRNVNASCSSGDICMEKFVVSLVMLPSKLFSIFS